MIGVNDSLILETLLVVTHKELKNTYRLSFTHDLKADIALYVLLLFRTLQNSKVPLNFETKRDLKPFMPLTIIVLGNFVFIF